MQEFFMDYGLWLLIALLVIIGVVFLLSGKRKTETSETLTSETPVAAETPPPIESPAVPPAPAPAHEVAPAPADIAPTSAVIEDAPAPVVATPAADVPEPETAVEPAPPAPEPTSAPKPEPVAVPVAQAPTDNGGDNLLKLKGVGPKLGALLTELGVTSFAQIASWTDSDIATIDAKLGNFKGRPVRDQWVDQAKYLAAGDIAGFEAKYGKL